MMVKRGWEYIEELQNKSIFIRDLKNIRKTMNHDWDNQIEKLKSFVPEENHRHYITFCYLGVLNSIEHRDVEIESVEYDSNSRNFNILTRKMGVKNLIELEIWAFEDCYNAPESAEDMANVVYHKI